MSVADNSYAVSIDGNYFNTNNARLNNAGTIELTNASGAAVAVYGGGTYKWQNVAIDNLGTIEVAGIYAAGIQVNSMDTYSTIDNSGLIDVTSTGGAAQGISVGNKNYGYISNLNSGTITVTTSGEDSDAYGIYVDDNYGSVKNSGTMTVTTSGEDSDAYGIYVEGSNSGSVENSGTMTVTTSGAGSGAEGIYVKSNYSSVKNSGTMTVTTSGAGSYGSYFYSTYGIYVYANQGAGSVENSGTMTVTTGGIYSDAAGIHVYYNYGSVTNSGTMTVTTSGEDSDAAGIHVYYNYGTITNSGTLSVTAEGEQSGATGIEVGGNFGTITNSDTMTVTTNGDHSDAAGISVNGNLEYGSVENSGTMTVTANSDYSGAAGIHVYYNSSSVKNSGTMTVTASGAGSEEDNLYSAHGIYVNANQEVGSVENSGTMTVTTSGEDSDAEGIRVYDNSGSVKNSDTMEVTTNSDHSGAAGIHVYDNSGSVENSGTMTVTTNSHHSGAVGIYINANQEYGSVENSGTMTVTANGDYSGAAGIFAETNGYAGSIVNSGIVNASGIYALGVEVQENYGSVVNAEGAQISATGSFAAGISTQSNSADASIENFGSITVTHEESTLDVNYSFGIFAGWGEDGAEILNEGTITVQGAESGLAGGIVSLGEDSTVNNSGTITVEGGGYVFGVLDGFLSYIDNIVSVTNSGTIEALGSDGELSEFGSSLSTPIADVTNEESGVLRGSLSVGSLDNAGLIQLPNTESYVATSFIQQATGTLGISLYSDDDAENGYNITHSTLLVGEDATLANGTIIDVDVKTAAANQELLIGETLAGVIRTGTGITADAEQIETTDNSALLAFTAQLSNEDTWLDLFISQDLSILEATQNSGRSGVYGAAATLDELTGSDDPEIGGFINGLFGLETDGQVANQVEQVSPGHITSLPRISEQMFHTFNSVVQARLNSVRGFNSGDVAFSDNTLWAKPFGSRAEQDDDNGINGYVAKSYGLGIGADGEYSPDNRFGVALFYSRTNVDTNDVRQEADMNTFNLLAYGSNQLIDDSTQLFYQLGVGLQQVDTDRYIDSVDTKATADYTAKSLYAQVKGSKTINLSDRLETMLSMAMAYTYYDSPSYNEKGAGGLNLNVDDFNSDSLIIEAQSDFVYKLTQNMELLATIGLGYDLIDDDVSVNSSFEGASSLVFATKGIDSSPVVYNAGVGMAQKLADDLSFDLKYDMEGRGSDYMNHMLSAKIDWKF